MVSSYAEFMDKVREVHPLVHHITNYVTVNDCANICICSGGAPVMTDEAKDVRGMVPIASAVVINMGTLNERTVKSMLIAGKIAKEKGIPVIFDAVGAGATGYRNEVAKDIIKTVKPDVIKGNDGEISFLSGIEGGVRGVDATSTSGDMGSLVKDLAQRHGCVVVSTGKIDHVSDGDVVYELSNGTDLESAVSGTGCMLSSVLGSYAGANGVSAEAMVAGITAFNIAAEKSAADAKGPGSFKVGLFDNLFNLRNEDLKEAKVKQL